MNVPQMPRMWICMAPDSTDRSLACSRACGENCTTSASTPMETATAEIAATAARLVVEEGLEYGPAKRRAAKQLALSGRSALPDNAQIELAVEEYIAIFCAESQ